MAEDRGVKKEHRTCRVYGHAWDFTTVKREDQNYLQGLRCLRCSTERFVKINTRTGELGGSRYAYPEGYLLNGGGALTQKERAGLRLTEVRSHQRKGAQG